MPGPTRISRPGLPAPTGGAATPLGRSRSQSPSTAFPCSPSVRCWRAASFPQLQLDFGLPAAEATAGRDLTQPFHFDYLSGDGFDVYSRGALIPEGTLPALWPEVALTKLADPTDGSDPQELPDKLIEL